MARPGFALKVRARRWEWLSRSLTALSLAFFLLRCIHFQSNVGPPIRQGSPVLGSWSVSGYPISQARSSDSLRFATTILLAFASFVALRVGRSYRVLNLPHCSVKVCNQARAVGQQESGRADRPHPKRSQSGLKSNFQSRSFANRTATGNFRLAFRRTAPS